MKTLKTILMKLDTDLKNMTLAQLRQEVMKFRTAIRKEQRHTGNRRCWINLSQLLPEGGEIKPLSLSKDEFLSNCGRYFDRNQKK